MYVRQLRNDPLEVATLKACFEFRGLPREIGPDQRMVLLAGKARLKRMGIDVYNKRENKC